MTTITMTFPTLKKICLPRPLRYCWKSKIISRICNQQSCPIWKRAEKREAKAWGTTVDDPRFQAHMKLSDKVNRLISRIEEAHKDAAKSKLVFGPESKAKKPIPRCGHGVKMSEYCGKCAESMSFRGERENPRRG